jgi:alanyl-tRNA synthetase
MHQLVPELITQMGVAYPELSEHQALIMGTLEREESKFRETLARGLGLLDTEMAKLPQGGILAGDVAFKLYDTFGFPVDLTQDVLVRQNMQLDVAGFDTAMNAQKEVARQSWVGSGQNFQDKVWFELDEKNITTTFVGYDALQAQSKILGLLKDGAWVDSIQAGDEAAIITDVTPFYAEQGGQVADHGGIGGGIGDVVNLFKVSQVQKPTGKYVAHAGVLESGSLKLGDVVDMQVCATRRANIAAHHSATHLLHEALRKHLGDHVAQKGSLVEPDRLRFDISHSDSISRDVLDKIAAEVNAQIRSNAPVAIAEMPIDAAKKLGARALFGEKYGDVVRVVQMGHNNYSIELCGGTHVQHLGQIGALRLLGESGVSAGVRRIEAVVGAAAEQLALQDVATLQNLAIITKASVAELPVRLEKLLAEHKSLSREVSDLRRQLATNGGSGQADKPHIEQINGVNFMAKIFEGLPAQDLKPLADQFKQQIGSGVVVLLTSDDAGRASLVVGVTTDLTASISAVDLVRVGASALRGAGGGGRPDLAQAGGPHANLATNAVADIKQKLVD